MMIVLWIMLLLLHQRHALIPVITVQLGQPVSFECFFHESEYSNTRVKWYKQSVGETLQLLITLMKATENPKFEHGFSPSRFHLNHNSTMSTLTILKTIPADEAVYHCGVTTWRKDTWTSTYLSVKGHTQGKTGYTVIQQPAASDPLQPGDSVSLQCSVLSDSEKKSCDGDYSVLWFGVGSDKSHPNILYADRNRHDECEEKPDGHFPQRSCIYRLSKNVSSSDARTYYCAVAACGEILFGNGTNLEIQGRGSSSGLVSHTDNIIVFLLCAIFATCVIVLVVLIYATKKNKPDYCDKDAVYLQEKVAKRNLKRDDTCVYSAAVFTMMKSGRGGTRARERIYAAVKAFGLDK